MTTIRNSSLKSQRFLMSQTIGVTLLFFLPSTGNLVSFASPFPIDVPYYYFICPSLLSIWQGFYIKASEWGLHSAYGKVKPGFLLCQGPRVFVHGGKFIQVFIQPFTFNILLPKCNSILFPPCLCPEDTVTLSLSSTNICLASRSAYTLESRKHLLMFSGVREIKTLGTEKSASLP